MVDERVKYAPFALFEHDDRPGFFSLILSDEYMVSEEQLAAFEDHGREPGGYSWADVALGLIRARHPELEGRLDLDPEGSMLWIEGSDQEALELLAGLLHGLFHDLTALREAVSTAPFEHQGGTVKVLHH